MRVKVNYFIQGTYYSSNPAVKLQIIPENDERFCVRFSIPVSMSQNSTVDYKKISSQDFLSENKIDYITRYNSKYEDNQVIPIGLLDYDEGYSESVIKIANITNSELHRVEMLMEGIIEAIKMKMSGARVYSKCIQRIEETIEL